MSEKIQAAPGLHGCCDPAGRMLLLARLPVDRDRLIATAVARGEGSPETVRERVTDMLACGMLIEIDEG